ncbi:MAG: FAD-binding oxidoreductase [Actinomycetota bacterium]
MSDSTIDPARIRAAVTGEVIGPDDSRYDEARSVFYGGFDYRPAVIVRPAGTEDVARAVGLAAETGAELAIRSGGHSLAGHSTTEGGVVLDLGAMRELEIDLAARTAWAETGLTAGEYTSAVGEHGLATGFGDTGSVGIGGITLSGGIGFLARRHGLTIDSVVGAEVVTADGRILAIDADSHPDLFWAIRGGGGNFGVVTRLGFRLHPVSGIVGGMLVLPASPEVVAQFVEEAEGASEDLTTIANLMVAPPMPFLPPEVHGRLVLVALMAHTGDTETGTADVGRFRNLAEPLADTLQPMRYPQLFIEEPPDFHPTAVGINLFTDAFDVADAKTAISHLEASTAMASVVQLRVLGGAVSRVPADATAFAHRDRKMMLNVAAMYQDPGEVELHTRWVRGLADALRRGDDGAYSGFVGAGDDSGPERAYPPATWQRLRAVKRRYDPGNLFRLNLNIPPA